MSFMLWGCCIASLAPLPACLMGRVDTLMILRVPTGLINGVSSFAGKMLSVVQATRRIFDIEAASRAS